MIEIERLQISEITEQHLQDLVIGEAAESPTLEFKRELKIGIDNDKREFCTDVASFANAAGGLILYGIRADDGVAVEVVGLTATSADELKLQAEQILQSGINPRLPWKKVEAISLSNGYFVIAVKIQRSHISPHAAGKDGVFRFFTRGSSGKLAMDIPQVRSSFLLSEGLREKLRAFRAERIGRIIANDGIVPLTIGHKLILHIVPLESLADRVEYNVSAYHGHRAPELMALGSKYSNTREFNIDGVAHIHRTHEKTEANGYVQLFQNGIIEAVDSGVVFFRQHGRENYNNSINARYVLEHLIHGTQRYLTILKNLTVDAPVYVMVSMTGMRRLAMWTSDHDKMPKLCDRDDLIFPVITVPDLAAEPHEILRPTFDTLWRSFGLPHCDWYDATGAFSVP